VYRTHAATGCIFVGAGAGGVQGDMICFAHSTRSVSARSLSLCENECIFMNITTSTRRLLKQTHANPQTPFFHFRCDLVLAPAHGVEANDQANRRAYFGGVESLPKCSICTAK
jgi:hypothetical protein